MPSHELTTEEAKILIDKINKLYAKFKMEMSQLRKERNALINEVHQKTDKEKIQKILNKLKD